ncbi:hypothetical protein HDU85_001051 [Gaertneriomyces sp. JEL0708]|nr:hypothetical protein HDU85_001051 [Gaertneriomyces sp. JEL0708]
MKARSAITALRAALPTYQIFAANTGVGKTIFSTTLCRAAADLPLRTWERQALRQDQLEQGGRSVYYIKPVQTGYPEDSDARHVETFCPKVHARTIFTYKEPAGAHITAVRENKPVTDDELLIATQRSLDEAFSKNSSAIAFLETAGGVNSPVMSGTLQADAYRPFRLPTVLIGDSQLGGVSTTLSAYESLLLRGYDVTAVLMFDSPKYQNHEAVLRNIDRNVPMFLYAPPPDMPRPRDPRVGLTLDDRMLDATNMMVYYGEADAVSQNVVTELLDTHKGRIDRLEQMAAEGERKIWWPFTQHNAVKTPTVIDSAYGEFFTTYNSKISEDDSSSVQSTSLKYDACSSWWTQSFGHADRDLTMAAARASGRYGHVIFPECVNEPSLQLAERLLETAGSGWASRVFYSDNGSTAMEVAIKAALRRSELQIIKAGKTVKGHLGVVGLEGSYHGDTIGSMDASNPNVYNEQINWYEGRGLWFTPPTLAIKDGHYRLRLPSWFPDPEAAPSFSSIQAIFDVNRRDERSKLLDAYVAHINSQLSKYLAAKGDLGALILEPLLLGAGGMQFVDPLFQYALIRAVRDLDTPLPVIFDEVFVGFHRLGLGFDSPGSQLLFGELPDAACYAKCLTGGLVPLSATLVNDKLYECFLGETKKEALLHGHSYTAHPVGCQVAIASLEKYQALRASQPTGIALYEGIGGGFWSDSLVTQLSSLSHVDGVVALGSVLAIELVAADKGYASGRASRVIERLRREGVFARPLGNVIYIMSPIIAASSEHERKNAAMVGNTVLEIISRN